MEAYWHEWTNLEDKGVWRWDTLDEWDTVAEFHRNRGEECPFGFFFSVSVLVPIFGVMFDVLFRFFCFGFLVWFPFFGFLVGFIVGFLFGFPVEVSFFGVFRFWLKAISAQHICSHAGSTYP